MRYCKVCMFYSQDKKVNIQFSVPDSFHQVHSRSKYWNSKWLFIFFFFRFPAHHQTSWWFYNFSGMDIFDLRLPVTTLISSSFKSLMVRIYVFELKIIWYQFSDGGSFLCFLYQKCFSTIVWAEMTLNGLQRKE